MPKKSSIYYDVLKWGTERGDEGGSFQELNKFLSENRDYPVNQARLHAIFIDLFTLVKLGSPTLHRVNKGVGDGENFHLKVEAAFRYLEIEELEHARKSSQSATCIAITAIVIGIIVGGVQIWVGLTQ